MFKVPNGTKADIILVVSYGYYIPCSQSELIPYFANSENGKNNRDELFYSGLILSGGQKAWRDSTNNVNRNDGIWSYYVI